MDEFTAAIPYQMIGHRHHCAPLYRVNLKSTFSMLYSVVVTVLHDTR
jgi:hypothetical protein